MLRRALQRVSSAAHHVVPHVLLVVMRHMIGNVKCSMLCSVFCAMHLAMLSSMRCLKCQVLCRVMHCASYRVLSSVLWAGSCPCTRPSMHICGVMFEARCYMLYAILCSMPCARAGKSACWTKHKTDGCAPNPCAACCAVRCSVSKETCFELGISVIVTW